ncbi:hypothetical protein P5673_028292 [Acropora cervicornis]|uniref:Uncharacterized protein n=1 Tax=Acropora cervicornis TaxID=6130 RepID=A0AAD9PXJ0_ACRCE|nr:hypothetical protein P5673_028292 [Acropora cervicornis]
MSLTQQTEAFECDFLRYPSALSTSLVDLGILADFLYKRFCALQKQLKQYSENVLLAHCLTVADILEYNDFK